MLAVPRYELTEQFLDSLPDGALYGVIPREDVVLEQAVVGN